LVCDPIDAGAFASDREFLELLDRARQKDTVVMLELFRQFDVEAAALVRHIPMPREDAMQSLRLIFKSGVVKP
jgi:hypothetical protein